MQNNKVLPGLYRHYKGKEYNVIGVAKHSETLEDLVVYETLYENELSKLWVRPLSMFTEMVEVDGQKIPRFEYLGNPATTIMNDINSIILRKTVPGDLETLFIHQVDDEAAYMAAFVNENFKNKDAYVAKWNKLLTDETKTIYTILLDDKIVGSISTWQLGDDLQISYGLGKEYWNKGITTHALRQFLAIARERPLFGRVAFDNVASARVLTKCGFKKIYEDSHYAHARKKEIAEFVFLLEE